MIRWTLMGLGLLFWTLCLATPIVLCSQLNVAYVTDRRVLMCSDLAFVESLNNSHFENCKDQSSLLQSPNTIQRKDLTVWYNSPANVALLLNNSKILHLSLVQYQAFSGPVLFEYFTVQRLETLSITYAFWKPRLTFNLVLGRDRDALFYEEVRMAVIHTSVLKGKTELKSYTVQTQADHTGLMDFPNIHMSHSDFQEASKIFVTFLY